MKVDDTKYKTFYVDATKLEMMLKLQCFCLASKKVKVYVKDFDLSVIGIRGAILALFLILVTLLKKICQTECISREQAGSLELVGMKNTLVGCTLNNLTYKTT